MSLPYTPHLITKLLRDMSDDRLREATPAQFQMHPVAKHITPAAIISELINNERATRRV